MNRTKYLMQVQMSNVLLVLSVFLPLNIRRMLHLLVSSTLRCWFSY